MNVAISLRIGQLQGVISEANKELASSAPRAAHLGTLCGAFRTGLVLKMPAKQRGEWLPKLLTLVGIEQYEAQAEAKAQAETENGSNIEQPAERKLRSLDDLAREIEFRHAQLQAERTDLITTLRDAAKTRRSLRRSERRGVNLDRWQSAATIGGGCSCPTTKGVACAHNHSQRSGGSQAPAKKVEKEKQERRGKHQRHNS